ncbi:MAG: type IV toxin-antitoxin system AbiEi family antitoxin domain-containing protein [Acidimicrobiia bacterium]|nr:MAG: type IV toxin-antitoxin system AbiEi family antitoxin domain-containing protein [Acidimicrobiia bacterium]
MQTVMDRLYDLAEPQAGYFTTAQARAVGVSKQELYYMRGRGDLRNVAHGIQRIVRFPATKHEDIMVACLWAGPRAVASHATAMVVYGIGETMPAVIHVTVPHRFRGKRSGVLVHQISLDSDEVTRRDGIPVTSPLRTIADVATSNPAGAVAGLSDALDRGIVHTADLQDAAERYPATGRLLRGST